VKIGLLQVFKEGELSYIASYPKLQIYSYGKTIHEAILRLKEIIKFYIESAKELDISVEDLCNTPPEDVFSQLDTPGLPKEGWIEIDVKSNLN
jgi:predicted RNase H-like HicB family nuclease